MRRVLNDLFLPGASMGGLLRTLYFNLRLTTPSLNGGEVIHPPELIRPMDQTIPTVAKITPKASPGRGDCRDTKGPSPWSLTTLGVAM